ncbi:pyrimidine reductase family protein [Agromyces aurantiacus]|uniref:Pyrimidine reductase family protein n=1 Tax=Agromyces aurantiacus TaxID=165814 RepID=A0ABV9QZX3_9MICO|nr:pyrimidine reductase family protein [Agromyces aurantiacus]MBM7505520.1 riboflavin biosynthesis pyrimidine reductase [Agromyces aurantiacus]
MIAGSGAAFDADRMHAAYAVDVVDAGARAEAAFCRVNMISSLDGAATLGGRSGTLGDAQDQRLMSVLRSHADVVLVGSGTVAAEGYGGAAVAEPDAAWRTARGRDPQPRFAVVSSRLAFEPSDPFFAEALTRPIVVTNARAPRERRDALSGVADVVIAGDERVDLRAALDALAARGLRSVLSEGGPGLFGALAEADLVDEACVTVSPTLVAGDAPRIASSAHEVARSLRLVHAIAGERMLFVRYARA